MSTYILIIVFAINHEYPHARAAITSQQTNFSNKEDCEKATIVAKKNEALKAFCIERK